MKIPNIKQLTTDIINFQNLVLKISEYMEQNPEEVIRELVNSHWDIRECLNYKDIISIVEAELDHNQYELNK